VPRSDAVTSSVGHHMAKLLHSVADRPPNRRVADRPRQLRIIGRMLLALNVGNTNIKLGLVRDELLVSVRRAATRPDATADELELLIDGLLRLDDGSLDEVDAMVIGSVVPAVGVAIRSIAERRSIPLVTTEASTFPIPVRVDHPAEVGADRLLNALAAHRLFGGPAVVLDFGTATTADAVAADGAYVGGAIAPGIEMGLEALATRTAQLPRIELRAPARAIGTNTVAAMRSGTVLGYLGLARELIARVSAELSQDAGGGRVKTILTGGLSEAPWMAELGPVDAIEPDLTIKGLMLLYSHHAAMAAAAGLDSAGSVAGSR
jgi:type III pantothenate kinase